MNHVLRMVPNSPLQHVGWDALRSGRRQRDPCSVSYGEDWGERLQALAYLLAVVVSEQGGHGTRREESLI